MGNGGHDGERGDLGLVVQFMVDQLSDPATRVMTREQLERIERMLPTFPIISACRARFNRA